MQFLDLEEKELDERNITLLIDYLQTTDSVRVMVLSNNFLNDNCVKMICQSIRKSKV